MDKYLSALNYIPLFYVTAQWRRRQTKNTPHSRGLKFLAPTTDFEALARLFSAGHIWTAWETIQSPLVSWTRAIIQRGFLPLAVGSASYFNDVVEERAVKAQACHKYFWM